MTTRPIAHNSPADLERLSEAKLDIKDPDYLVYLYLFDALEYASKFVSGRLMDIGCGNKPYKKLFGNISEHFGCDIVQSSASQADIICDVLNIPCRNESFDSVLSTQVIEHVAEPQSLCSEAFRILKPHGYFILSGPMYWYLHEEPYDFYRFTKYGFRHMLEKAGFEVTEVLPNGGKWAMLGLTSIHTIQSSRFNKPFVVKWINKTCSYLDKRRFDEISTSNYVVIARKP